MVTTQTNLYDSSTILSSSYIYETKQLYIGFKHATYLYKDVSLVDYLTFANDKSQGIALNTLIKGVYEFEKLENEK